MGLYLRERLADRARDDQIRAGLIAQRRLVDDDELVAAVVVYQTRRGVDRERGAGDDEHVGLGDIAHGLVERILVEPLLVEHDIGLDAPAAGARRHAGGSRDRLRTNRNPCRGRDAPDPVTLRLSRFSPSRRIRKIQSDITRGETICPIP